MSEYVINININENTIEKNGKAKVTEQDKIDKERQEKRIKILKGSALKTVAVAGFVYNYVAVTTRFGQRGQDIQDQQALQDKFVNTGLAITAATIINPVAGAVAFAYTVLSEIINVSKQNAAYNYKRELDIQQKNIMNERIGRDIYSSSRR